MHITGKILIFDRQCIIKKCVELLKEQFLFILVYDFWKFSSSFIKFTVNELKVTGFLKPPGFLKHTCIFELQMAKFLKQAGFLKHTGLMNYLLYFVFFKIFIF